MHSAVQGREWRSLHAKLSSADKEADAPFNVQQRQKRIADHRAPPLPVLEGEAAAAKSAAATPAGRGRRRRRRRPRKGEANAVKVNLVWSSLEPPPWLRGPWRIGQSHFL